MSDDYGPCMTCGHDKADHDEYPDEPCDCCEAGDFEEGEENQ